MRCLGYWVKVVTSAVVFFAAAASGAVTLSVTSNTLGLAANAGTSAPVSDSSIGLNATGSGSTSFTISTNAAWLSASPPSGNIPAGGSAVTITITANPNGLEANTYTGTVTAAGGGSSATITVTFTVQGVDLSAKLRSGFQPITAGQTASGNIDVTVSNNQQENLQVSFLPRFVSWLSVAPASPLAPGAIQVNVDTSSLPAGPATASIVISCLSPAPCLPKTVNIQITVVAAPPVLSISFQDSNGGPHICPTDCALDLTASPGPPPALAQLQLTASGSGSGSIPFTASVNVSAGPAGWLSVSPPSGKVNWNDAGVTLKPITTVSSLRAFYPTYAGSVTVSAGGSTVTVTISITVNGSDITASLHAPFGAVTPGHAASNSIDVSVSGRNGIAAQTTITLSKTAVTPSDGSWLVVNQGNTSFPASGQASIPITVNAASPGTYDAKVTLGPCSTPCANVTIDVTVTVNPPTLTSSQPSLSFSGTAASPPAVQSILIQASDGSALSFSQTVSYQSPTPAGVSWLQVQATAQTTPATLSVSANPSTLSPGTYRANLQLQNTSAGNSPPLSIAVSLTVLATVTANPSSLIFPAPGATPLQQTVSLATDGGPPLGFDFPSSTDDGGKWLSVTRAASTIPTTLTVTVNPAVVKQGSYHGTITIQPNGGSQPVTVSVTYTVSSTPVLSVDTSEISFSGQIGGTCGQQSRSVQSSDSSTTLNFQAAAAVTSPPGGTWLGVSPASGSTPGTLNVTCSLAGLAAGNYSGSISISIPGGSSTSLQIPVSLAVTPSGGTGISVSVSNLTFDYDNTTSSSVSGLSQAVNVTSSSPVGFTATVVSGQNWISVSPASGTTNGSVTVTVDPSQLIGAAQPYQGAVVINNATVNVSFTVAGIPSLTRVAPLSLDGGGYQTNYFLLNPPADTLPVSYSISVAGNAAAAGAVGPQSIVSWQTPGTASQVTATWAELSFDRGAGGFALIQSTSGSPQESAAPLAAVPVSHFFVPFDNSNGFATSVNLFSRPPTSVDCAVNGWTAGSGTFSVDHAGVPGRGNNLIDLRQWSAFYGTQGVAEFICPQPVFAAVLRTNAAGNVTVHDVVPAGSGDRTTVTREIPAVLDGSSYMTVFALVNTDSISQNYSFQFWNNRNGGAVTSPLEQQTNGMIAPGGVVFISSDGSGPAASLLGQLPGPLPFAELTAARTVAAFAIYEQGIDGSTISAESAIPLTQAAAPHWTVPVSGSNGFSTAISIVNANNGQAANLALTYYVGGGPATETMAVPAGGSLLIETANDPNAAGLDGMLDLVSDQSVNVLVFRIASDGSFAAMYPLPAN
jgi:hypothetical protein